MGGGGEWRVPYLCYMLLMGCLQADGWTLSTMFCFPHLPQSTGNTALNSFWIPRNNKLCLYSTYKFGISLIVIKVFVEIHFFFFRPFTCRNCTILDRLVCLESGRSGVRIPLAKEFFPDRVFTNDLKMFIPVATLPGA